jgi:hypothetical protein
MTSLRLTSNIISAFFIFNLIIFASCTWSIYGDDNSIITIPVIKYPVDLDGTIDVNNEWKDAHKITFSQAESNGLNITVYLKYEPNNRIMYGAFTFPSKSSVPLQPGLYEGVHFLFDIANSTSGYIGSTAHDIALYSDRRVQYSIGDEEKLWIINATSAENESELPLEYPFSKIDFRTIPMVDGWGGEFKIYFNVEPDLYSFSLLQEAIVIGRTGQQIHQTSNYPSTSIALNPSTWTKISFGGMPSEEEHEGPNTNNTGIQQEDSTRNSSTMINNSATIPTPVPQSSKPPETTQQEDSTRNSSTMINNSATIPTPVPQSSKPPNLFLSAAEIQGLKVTITGEARSHKLEGQITNIHIDWGDGNAADFKNFPSSHLYTHSGLYTITITVLDNDGLSTTKNIQAQLEQPSTSNMPSLDVNGWAAILTGISAIIGGIVAFVKLFVKRKSASD